MASRILGKFTQTKDRIVQAATTFANKKSAPKTGIFLRSLSDLIRNFLNEAAHGQQDEYMTSTIREIQEELQVCTREERAVLVQQLIFVNIVGYDTTWANFAVLEVMSMDDYSSKRIAYTAASQLWNSSTDVVLMAVARVQKDLTTVQTLLTSCVLTSIPPYLTQSLAGAISQQVIALMTSTRPYVRQKAIMTFYHICLQHPEALKHGFVTLRSRLDDDDSSVVFSALTVVAELATHNPQNFVPLIPKLHKMLESTHSNWVILRIIAILRLLCTAEARLPKKLVTPFTSILETTGSITVLFECVRAIIEIPITNTVLLTFAAQRMQSFLEHQDVNLRFLCLTLFIKLMQIQPKLVAQHRDLITQCLDSSDEPTRMMALDLLAALANAKTIDGIVGKMFDHFKNSHSAPFKNQLITRVVEMCSRSDYALVQDFEWYVSVLMDFVNEGGITCLSLVGDQFLDLALRVPATRPRLIADLAPVFEDPKYKGETRLLLAISHIIGDYAEDAAAFDKVLQPNIVDFDERVQASCVSTAFKLFLKADPGDRPSVERALNAKLELLATSQYAEVQDIASLTSSIVAMLREEDMGDALAELASRLTPDDDAEEPGEVARPPDLDAPVALFAAAKDDAMDLPGYDDAVESAPAAVRRLLDPAKPGEPKRKPKPRSQKRGAPGEERVVLRKGGAALRAQGADARPAGARPAALSDRLASIDLTAAIAEAEERANRPTGPTNTSLIAKQQAEAAARKAAAAPKRRHRAQRDAPEPEKARAAVRRRRGARQSEPPAEKPRERKASGPPITAPVAGARQQVIGENDNFVVTATEFHVDPREPAALVVDLLVRNKRPQALDGITIELVSPPLSETAPVFEAVPEVAPNASVSVSLTFAVDNQLAGRIVKLRFIPISGADSLDADLRVFPSFFLYPAPEEELEAAKEEAVLEQVVNLSGRGDARGVLQMIVNLFRGTVVATEEKATKIVFARALSGPAVLAAVKVERESISLSIKTSNEELLKILAREVGLQKKK